MVTICVSSADPVYLCPADRCPRIPPPVPTSRPVVLRQCVYGVVITSDTGVKSCQCNAGWVGDRCSEPVSSHCYRGSWDNAHGFCRCDPLWAGEVRAAARSGRRCYSIPLSLLPPSLAVQTCAHLCSYLRKHLRFCVLRAGSGLRHLHVHAWYGGQHGCRHERSPDHGVPVPARLGRSRVRVHQQQLPLLTQ